MKRLVILFLALLILSRISMAASYLGKNLNDIPLKCSLTTFEHFYAENLTCIFHSYDPQNVEVKFSKSKQRVYKFNSNNGKIFDLSRVAIFQNDEHNFDIYGVLNITPPKTK